MLRLLASLLFVAAVAQPATAMQLARDDGRGWIEPGKLQRRPSVFLFWDVDCAPCLVELQHLDQLQAAFPDAQLVIVSLSPRVDTRRALARFKPSDAALRAMAPSEPRGMLASLGDPQGVLPFSAAFDAAGQPCLSGVGALSEQRLRQAAAACH